MALTKTPIELSSTPSIVDGGNATAITIDSSENVLIGQTSASSGAVGTSLRQDGRNFFCAAENYSAHFNRNTSDGDIVHFAKDDTVVGSIGNLSNDVLIYSAASGHTGLRFGEGYYIPLNNSGGVSDNTVDIGLSSFRYKDIYLSGGAFIGGTGSANKLDDYEEGTWTATLSSSGGSFAASSTSFTGGKYTKIGNTVTAQIYSSAFNITNAGSGYAKISGLPFTSVSSSTSYGGVIFYHTTCFANACPTGYVAQNADFTISSIGDQSTTNAQAWKVANSVYFMMQVQYTTA